MAIPETAKLAENTEPENVSIKDVLNSTNTEGKVKLASTEKNPVKDERPEPVAEQKKAPTEKEENVKKPAEEVVETEEAPIIKTQEKQEKREKEKQVKKGSGCSLIPKPKCSCQSCSCFGCLIIILFLVLMASILYFRPPFVWNIIKSYMNAGYKPQTYSTVSTDAVTKRIETDLSQGKDATLTEQEMQSLLSKSLNINDVKVDVEPNYMRIVTDADNNNDHPLWLILEVAQQSDGNLKITKIGFNRIGAPSFLRNAISDSAFEALKLSGSDGNNSSNKMMTTAIDAGDNGISIESVRFDKDKVTIKGKSVQK